MDKMYQSAKFDPDNKFVSLKPRIMTKELWEGIRDCRKNFLQNQIVDPRDNPYMDPEVAASWIRSRNCGVRPDAQLFQLLSAKEFQKVLEKNQLLIEIVKPLLISFKELATGVGYSMALIDNQGVILLNAGEKLRVSQNVEAAVGSVWSEQTIGTTSDSLCMHLKRPIQLVDPENYSESLMNLNGIASSAPIMDVHGNVVGCIAFHQDINNPAWDDAIQKMCSHTLGLITSIATAVENKLSLQRSYDQLETANNLLKATHSTLSATMAFIDEGIITIDNSGKILNINREGARILRLKQYEIENRNISEFVANNAQIMNLVHKGEKADLEKTIHVGEDEQSYVINIMPVLDQDDNQVCGAVLRLNHTEKINALVTSRSGATAKYQFEDLIGEGKRFKDAIARGRLFAEAVENILIIGESGTGKELFAQSIHNLNRPRGPFIAVNCAAMPRNLIESELFGYEGGSFTGAEKSGRPGKIELAYGGTLFLDEIGDMPYELQAVLLRVLEDKQVMRIGGRNYKKVDFRLIAATNKDLYKMVKEQRFREDLYFRLSVLSIDLPPLRERSNDIEILSQYFIKNYCKKMGWKIPQINPVVVDRINNYNWPGNVRQLENALVYAANTARDKNIELENLPEYLLSDSNPFPLNELVDIATTTKTMNEEKGQIPSLADSEKKLIGFAFAQSKFDVGLAAEILQISKSTMYRKLKEYDIKSFK